MTSEVRSTAQFERDYHQIAFYLEQKTGSMRATECFAKDIDHAISLLTVMPELRAISQKDALARRRIREYYVRNYVVLYRIEQEIVYLVRVLHQSQQYDDEWYWE